MSLLTIDRYYSCGFIQKKTPYGNFLKSFMGFVLKRLTGSLFESQLKFLHIHISTFIVGVNSCGF